MTAKLVFNQPTRSGAGSVAWGRPPRSKPNGPTAPLDGSGRGRLLSSAHRLAERGLRVLLVAGGRAATPVDDPMDLTALGFVGIGDPLRPTVGAAVERCRQAGVRVIMLTGDHAATARSIAREAGLIDGAHDHVLTGAEIAELDEGELDERIEHTSVIAPSLGPASQQEWWRQPSNSRRWRSEA